MVNFCGYLFGDVKILFNDATPAGYSLQDTAIKSVALRALGALVAVIAATVFFSAVGLALTGSIGAAVFTAVAAVALGIIAYDLIQVGQNLEPATRHPLASGKGLFQGGRGEFKNTILARRIFS